MKPARQRKTFAPLFSGRLQSIFRMSYQLDEPSLEVGDDGAAVRDVHGLSSGFNVP